MFSIMPQRQLFAVVYIFTIALMLQLVLPLSLLHAQTTEATPLKKAFPNLSPTPTAPTTPPAMFPDDETEEPVTPEPIAPLPVKTKTVKTEPVSPKPETKISAEVISETSEPIAAPILQTTSPSPAMPVDEVEPMHAPVRIQEPASDIGIVGPPGFDITLFSDDHLAHDIFSMTTDTKGRIVVSGPGYIKTLIDDNGDGKADRALTYSQSPATGAQGMYFDGKDLFCTGDGGLLRYHDENEDGVADGPPQVFLKIKTGGEHTSHAILRGPDGWWYLITGNHTHINSSYATLPTSPVKEPHGGVILRFNPQLSGGEIFADGLRNCYDFAFSAQGEIFSYESDGERDISLPWYRPTRLFQSLPATNHGWIADNWIEENDGLGMPPVAGEYGRGSPSGVACYRHTQFPEKYRGSMFLLDWTYGVIRAVNLERTGTSYKGHSEDFITPRGNYGFAPTDVCIDHHGYLYVCTGGRGTRGAVFCVRYQGTQGQNPEEYSVTSNSTTTQSQLINQKVMECVRVPQPLSSWSRAIWKPMSKEVGEEAFIQLIQDTNSREEDRIRAIEILTEQFHGPDTDLMLRLSTDPNPMIRARIIWSLGRTQPSIPSPLAVRAFLNDPDPLVVRAALEALYGAEPATLNEYIPEFTKLCGHSDRFVRQATCRLLTRVEPETFRVIALEAVNHGWEAALIVSAAYAIQTPGVNMYALDVGLKILKGDHPEKLKLQAILTMQLGIGGVLRDIGEIPVAFQAYLPGTLLDEHERELDKYRIDLARMFPTESPALNREIARMLAMLQPANSELLTKVLAQTTPETDPIDDIHYLLVAARIPVERSAAQRQAIADALVHIDEKIAARHLPQDSNWGQRVREIYARLCDLDQDLSLAMVTHADFGRPGHITFLMDIPDEYLPKAVVKFLAQIEKDEENYPWTNDTIFLLSESKDPATWDLIRMQFENYAVRPAVLIVLAINGEEQDRKLLLQGLEASQKEVVEHCLTALEAFPATRSPAEQVALIFAARRLKESEQEFEQRDRIMKLLERNIKQDHGFIHGPQGYVPQVEALNTWTAYIEERYSNAVKEARGQDFDLTAFLDRIKQVDFQTGDSAIGEKLFVTRSCAQCHAGQQAIGPNLAGVTNRFSIPDLFTAIVDPHRDVSNRYQTSTIVTQEGKTYEGMIVYESVDGLLLRNATNQTVRLETKDILERKTSNLSLMPIGLLKDLKDEDLTDLYAYLLTLSPKQDAAPIKSFPADEQVKINAEEKPDDVQPQPMVKQEKPRRRAGPTRTQIGTSPESPVLR
jgi:putative membrane-bound dehydrogenase-like protein